MKRHFNGKTAVGPIIARSPDKRFWIRAWHFKRNFFHLQVSAFTKKWPTQSLYNLLLSWARATLVYDRQTYIHQCRQASQDLLEPELHRWSKIPTTFFLCIRPFGAFWHWNESGKMVCERQKHRQTGRGMVKWFNQLSCSPSYPGGLNCKTPSAVYSGMDYRYSRSLSVRSFVCPLYSRTWYN